MFKSILELTSAFWGLLLKLLLILLISTGKCLPYHFKILKFWCGFQFSNFSSYFRKIVKPKNTKKSFSLYICIFHCEKWNCRRLIFLILVCFIVFRFYTYKGNQMTHLIFHQIFDIVSKKFCLWGHYIFTLEELRPQFYTAINFLVVITWCIFLLYYFCVSLVSYYGKNQIFITWL